MHTFREKREGTLNKEVRLFSFAVKKDVLLRVFNEIIYLSKLVFLTAVTCLILSLVHQFIMNRLSLEQSLQIVQIYFGSSDDSGAASNIRST